MTIDKATMNGEELGLLMSLFGRVHKNIRIVAPHRQKIVYYKNNRWIEEKSGCYEYWDKNEMCENCISMRAYLQKNVTIKLEKKDNLFIMIIAFPLQVDEEHLVLEVLVDITNKIQLSGAEEPKDHVNDIINYVFNGLLTDKLTGVYNRRFIEENLPINIVSSISKNHTIAIALVDIDNFKDVNDQYGHIAGDELIKNFSKLIETNIRENIDWVARYGGDEFLICLKSEDKTTVNDIIERIRSKVEQHDFFIKGQSIRITTSIGVFLLGESTLTVEEVIARADELLYEAKKRGKNQIVVGQAEGNFDSRS